MTEAVTVADAGPVIHLDELGCLDLLEGFGEVHLPLEVKHEVAFHRPALELEKLPCVRISTGFPRTSAEVAAYARNLDLDVGEIAALNLLRHLQGKLFLCDDAAARLAAESMGFKVHGTIGIIVRAIRRSKRTPTEARTILEQIPASSTLHINGALLHKVIESLPK